MNDYESKSRWFDGPVMVADFIAKSGLLDLMLAEVGRVMVTLPLGLLRWLGEDLKTPLNSTPPKIYSAGGAATSGVVFIHDNEPFLWALVEVGGPNRPEPISPQPASFRSRTQDFLHAGSGEPRWRQEEHRSRWDGEDEDWRGPR